MVGPDGWGWTCPGTSVPGSRPITLAGNAWSGADRVATAREGRSVNTLSAALVTPVGRGAVATIRVCGAIGELIGKTKERLAFQAANGQPLSNQPTGKIVFGRWGQELMAVEEVIVCHLDAQTLEIHCHGGDAAVQRILADLSDAGCQVLAWQEQFSVTRDRLEVDCQTALSLASTWRTAEILHEQSAGLLRRAFNELLQLCEPGSFPDEFLRCIDALLEWSDFGIHLSRPWSVVLTGRPNVGKSSLINAILGYERAIVFDQPGTTRDVVTGETALAGWPVVLADTAGLRETSDELESAGIALARQRLQAADLRLVLIDLSQSPTEADNQLLAEWPEAIVVGHKCDLRDEWNQQLPEGAIRVSSVTKQGLEDLHRAIVQRLVPVAPPIGTPIPINASQRDLLQTAHAAALRNDQTAAQFAIRSL